MLLPGVLALTVVPKVMGRPVIRLSTPLTCQSPKIQRATPVLAHGLFLPNGSSYT